MSPAGSPTQPEGNRDFEIATTPSKAPVFLFPPLTSCLRHYPDTPTIENIPNMKNLLLLTMIALCSPGSAEEKPGEENAPAENIPTLTLSDGRSYLGVLITKTEPDGIGNW